MADRILGIIPAKARSRRAPGKNFRMVGSRRLIDYTIDAAKSATRLDSLCVTSDAPEILDHAKAVEVYAVERPPEMSADDVHASVPILHALETMGGASAFDYCVMLLPTFPMRTAETIDTVIGIATDANEHVISVTQLNKTIHHMRTLDGDGRAHHITDQKRVNFQSQDAPALYTINGCCYCAPSTSLLREKTFQFGDPLAYVTPWLDAFDIDTEDDLTTVEALLAART